MRNLRAGTTPKPGGTEVLANVLDGLTGFTVQPHSRGKRLLQGDGTSTIADVYSHRMGGRAFYLDTAFDYSMGRAKEVFDQNPRNTRLCSGQLSASPITRPSMVCFWVIGVSSSTTGQCRWSRTAAGRVSR